MSRLVLLRHEEAHPADAGGDALRCLTPVGRSRMLLQARALFEILPGLGLIYTSPLVRAVQTAEILVQAFDVDTPVTAHRAIVEPPSTKWLADLIRSGPSPLGVTAVVGHEPTLGNLVRHLLRDDDRFAGFRTGQATVLARNGDIYELSESYRGGQPV